MEASGYSLDLYCDSPQHSENVGVKVDFIDSQYHGETYSECKNKAKRAGWLWRNGKNICPKCR